MKRLTPEQVEQEIARLGGMSTPSLQTRWRELYGIEPPYKIRAGFLRLAIAYRLQEQTFGGLSSQTKRQLLKISAQSTTAARRSTAQSVQAEGQDLVRTGSTELAASKASVPLPVLSSPRPITLSAGTKLMREWNGSIEIVDVLDSGFGWRGKTYKTLSAVAVAITGTKWSGPKFFGLRDDQKRSKPGEQQSGSATKLKSLPSPKMLAELVGGRA